MNKGQILNDDFIENEVVQPKSHKKIKIAVAIAFSLAIIATTTLLIGYFKFDWFKSEIYNVDAKISRNLYQEYYFTETKNLKTKTTFTSGVIAESTQIITTNFMVIQTGRKELENNDFLNTATLVILDSKADVNNVQKEITSFNIYEPSKVKEFKSNPDGSKYPMAVFSFYNNGTITDIQLPNNMDLYNAQTINEFIESVIPKLSRNRKEDISNGLNIVTKKNKNKRTLVENQAPKELPDFKGSRFVKSVERLIENEKITKINSKSNLDLHTQKLDDEADFGLKEFFFEQKSEIISTGLIEKDNADLVNNLVKHFTFVKSKDLIESLTEKNKEGNEQVIEQWEEDINSPDSKARKLGFNFSGVRTKTLKVYNILGIRIEIKIKVGVENGKALCQIIFQISNLNISFGNTGVTTEYSRTWNTGDRTLLSFTYPNLPWLSLNFCGCGSLTFKVKFDSASKTKLLINFSGNISASAKVKAGYDYVESLSVGAKGTIISSSVNASITSGNNKFGLSATFAGGAVSVYAKGVIKGGVPFDQNMNLFNGWSSTWNI